LTGVLPICLLKSVIVIDSYYWVTHTKKILGSHQLFRVKKTCRFVRKSVFI